MSRLLLVTFELDDPGKTRESLMTHLKAAFRAWAKVGHSAYLIYTDKTPSAVRTLLTKHLSGADDIFVCTYATPAAWRGLSESTSAWIHKYSKLARESKDQK